jgi:hypothetical protein
MAVLPPHECIKYADIRWNGEVWLGQRHDMIMKAIRAVERVQKVVGDQGFVTSTGRFVDRKEAGRIAIAAGQITALKFQKHDLFSEELW